MNRKYIISLVMVAVVSSSLYGMYELRPPTTVIGGQAQYGNETYEESLRLYPLIVVGEITDLGIKVISMDTIAEDDNGNDYVYETHKRPEAEITIQIEEILKNEIGWTSDTVIVYDRVNAIVDIDGERVQSAYSDVVTHKIGDKGLFLIANDRGLRISGYASYYPIIDGVSTITTELDKKMHPIYLENGMNGKPPMDLELAKQLAKSDQ